MPKLLRSPRPLFRATLLLACCAVTACASALDGAVAEFDAGRLPAAALRFRELEPGLRQLSPAERVRYALYRGLTELALGDARRAESWLLPLKRAVDDDPRLLDDGERGRLLAAWRSMGHMPGER